MGSSGRKIAEMIGVVYPDEYAGMIGRANLFASPASERQRQRDVLPKDAALSIFSMLESSRVRIVFLGRIVARAFNLEDDWFRWRKIRLVEGKRLFAFDAEDLRPGGFLAAAMPHPAPKNLWYSDRGNLARATEFVKRTLDQARAERRKKPTR